MHNNPLTARSIRVGAVLFSTLALGLGGCATPMVTPQPPTFQSKMGYVADWEALADRTAKHFIASLKGENRPVYVAPGPSDMPFAAAYRNLLEEKLRAHLDVKQTAEGATVLRFSVQTFLYKDPNQKLPIEYGTFWATLAALSVPLRTISSVDTAIAAGAVAMPLVDILRSINDTTNAEVSLTQTVLSPDGTYLVHRDSTAFYIQPRELPFYWTHVPDSLPQAKQAILDETSLPVIGPSPNTATLRDTGPWRGAEPARKSKPVHRSSR